MDHIVVDGLASHFIGIHLRVEKDVFNSDEEFDRELPQVINNIKNHRCLYEYNMNGSFIPHNGPLQPKIYIASGLFTTGLTIMAKETKSSIYRTMKVLEGFNASGFHDILTRSSLNAKDTVSLYDKVYAEQHAYIDLLVLQKSSCFIPAMKGSSLSYMVERFQAFQQGDFGGDLLKTRGMKATASFRGWGF